MSIWNFLSFDAKAKIINALPLAYANFIGHQHITANSQNGDTDWLGQPLPVELAEISDFNKSTANSPSLLSSLKRMVVLFIHIEQGCA